MKPHCLCPIESGSGLFRSMAGGPVSPPGGQHLPDVRETAMKASQKARLLLIRAGTLTNHGPGAVRLRPDSLSCGLQPAFTTCPDRYRGTAGHRKVHYLRRISRRTAPWSCIDGSCEAGNTVSVRQNPAQAVPVDARGAVFPPGDQHLPDAREAAKRQARRSNSC